MNMPNRAGRDSITQRDNPSPQGVIPLNPFKDTHILAGQITVSTHWSDHDEREFDGVSYFIML
jgi:hypothetical protein